MMYRNVLKNRRKPKNWLRNGLERRIYVTQCNQMEQKTKFKKTEIGVASEGSKINLGIQKNEN